MIQYSKKPVVMLLLAGFIATLSSFAPNFGGEGYQIFVNNKMVLERFGQNMNTVQTLSLDEYPAGSQLTVRYYHCGKVGKNRTITIKDDKNTVLKQWKYTDVSEPVSGISCSMKDIFSLQTSSSNMHLYYASSELPEGRLLVNIQNNSTAKAVRK